MKESQQAQHERLIKIDSNKLYKYEPSLKSC